MDDDDEFKTEMLASELVKKLQSLIEQKGDCNIFLYDSVGKDQVSFAKISIQIENGNFIVMPYSMTEGDEDHLLARQMIREMRDEIANQTSRMLKVVETINTEYPDLDEDQRRFLPSFNLQ